MSHEAEGFVEVLRTCFSEVRDRIIERVSYVPDLAKLGKSCEDLAMPGHAAAVYRFLADEYGANAEAALARLAVEPDADFAQELRDLAGRRDQPRPTRGALLPRKKENELKDLFHHAMMATYGSRDGEKAGAAIYLEIAGMLRDWGRPELGLAFARRAAFLSPRQPDARALCAELRPHRDDLSEAVYLELRRLPPMDAIKAWSEPPKPKKAKPVEPFEKLAKRLHGADAELQSRFGELAPGDQEILQQVNQFREMFTVDVATPHGLKPPSRLRGHMTNWGWFSEGESATEQDWAERLKAWEWAREWATIAEEGGLRRGSDSESPYGPFLTLAPKSASLKDTKPHLGLEANEMLELDELGDGHGLEGAEHLAFQLFFGAEALDGKIDGYFSPEEQLTARRVASVMHERLRDVRRLRMDISESGDGRYVVSPEYLLGLTPSGKYLVGLWAYEVRS